MSNQRPVLLFDIDGTLVSTGGAGRLAMATAFTKLHGRCDQVDGVPFSGRTDRVIGRDLLLAHGLSDSSTTWELFRDAYLQELPSALEVSAGEVLPGVLPLLQELAEYQAVAIGLLTGNLRDGARLKLGYYGIDGFFAFGGFGDEHFERNDVARDAFSAARSAVGGNLEPANVWVIGDTPLDIGCARAIGAKVLAVATGQYSMDELRKEKPDLLAENLREIKVSHLIS